MRRDAFRKYLNQAGYQIEGVWRPYTQNAISFRVAKCARAEREKNCDLDAEFAKDKLHNLLSELEGNIKASVKHYKNFCAHPPLEQPGEAEVLESDAEDENDEEAEIAPDITFKLEAQLRDFIAQNIQNIPCNGSKLTLYENGVEFATDAGFIDILAIDENGNYVIFELKRGRTPDHVIGQLARYIGWVKQNLDKNKQVYGVIVAKSISKNLHYAQSAIPNVSLLEYEIKFELKTAEREKAK